MYRVIKRIMNLFCSFVGVIVLSPFFLIISLLIKVTSKGPVFFVHERVGLNGKKFKLIKFRTMVNNAEEMIASFSPEQKKEWEENYKLKDDPRITKIGRILRKTSIDELPQMINVLLGQMTLIGNRPYLPREKKDMNGYFDEIVKTKPGLTGYWQVSGRSKTDFKTRLKLESYYSNHMSLKMDIKIFLL